MAQSISYKELIRFVWSFMKRQKGRFALILGQDILNCLDLLIWPFLLRWVIDIFTAYEGQRMLAWDPLRLPMIGAICFLIFIEINSRTMGLSMARAIPRLQAGIRMHMFDHVQRHSPYYFNERFAGNLASKISDMTTAVESILQQLWWPLIPALALSILGAIFLGLVNLWLAVVLLIWICIHLSLSLGFAKSCDRYEHLHAEARSTLLGKIVDSLTNNFAVNTFYRFRYERAALEPFQEAEQDSAILAKRHVEKMRSVTSLFYITICFVGINGLMIYLWLHHQITTGEAAQVFGTMWNIANTMWNVGGTLPVVFQSLGTAKQAYLLMKDPSDIQDLPMARELQIQTGEIVFENVSFQYGQKKLFENKDVRIQGGEKVGLVGFTGSGKSTFVNLILRFFPLHQGRILIDGQDIVHVTLESLRRHIALIPQDPLLFHRTLQENITYGKTDATEAELHMAAQLSHCDAFISHLPDGYATKVGERGTKLSGGERQRIAIARALLVHAPILILDEATSSLDSMTEQYIQQSLDQLMQGRTTIVIAHRLSTLSRMDRLLVFDQGKIVEEGDHATLIRRGGLYTRLWNMQVGGFLPDKPITL